MLTGDNGYTEKNGESSELCSVEKAEVAFAVASEQGLPGVPGERLQQFLTQI